MVEKTTFSTVLTEVIADEMRKIITKRGYMNESDFIRQAVIEKIEREKQ